MQDEEEKAEAEEAAKREEEKREEEGKGSVEEGQEDLQSRSSVGS